MIHLEDLLLINVDHRRIGNNRDDHRDQLVELEYPSLEIFSDNIDWVPETTSFS